MNSTKNMAFLYCVKKAGLEPVNEATFGCKVKVGSYGASSISLACMLFQGMSELTCTFCG